MYSSLPRPPSTLFSKSHYWLCCGALVCLVSAICLIWVTSLRLNEWPAEEWFEQRESVVMNRRSATLQIKVLLIDVRRRLLNALARARSSRSWLPSFEFLSIIVSTTVCIHSLHRCIVTPPLLLAVVSIAPRKTVTSSAGIWRHTRRVSASR